MGEGVCANAEDCTDRLRECDSDKGEGLNVIYGRPQNGDKTRRMLWMPRERIGKCACDTTTQDDIPDIRRGLSLSVVFLSAKRISVLFSPQLDYHRALLLVPFLWANIRQDCRREN